MKCYRYVTIKETSVYESRIHGGLQHFNTIVTQKAGEHNSPLQVPAANGLHFLGLYFARISLCDKYMYLSKKEPMRAPEKVSSVVVLRVGIVASLTIVIGLPAGEVVAILWRQVDFGQ